MEEGDQWKGNERESVTHVSHGKQSLVEEENDSQEGEKYAKSWQSEPNLCLVTQLQNCLVDQNFEI